MPIKMEQSGLLYNKPTAYAETGSERQVQRVTTFSETEQKWKTLTDKERQQLGQGQFAFGSAFPYIFDGLANAATHQPKLFQDHNDFYYFLQLPINDLCHLSLMEYKKHNKKLFTKELLRQGKISGEDTAKRLRCIPIAKGDYLSIQPLIIGFRKKKETSNNLRTLITFNESMKAINTVIIFVLKMLIDKDNGVFPCPSALQAKIVHTLKEDIYGFFDGLEAQFLRKYYMYVNSMDGSQKNVNYITADAIDLWEHVLPSNLKKSGEYIHLRNEDEAKKKLENANSFFDWMDRAGLMQGAKAFPSATQKEGTHCGVDYDKKTKKYRIYFKRDEKYYYLLAKKPVLA
jgi:hypothetical protein